MSKRSTSDGRRFAETLARALLFGAAGDFMIFSCPCLVVFVVSTSDPLRLRITSVFAGSLRATIRNSPPETPLRIFPLMTRLPRTFGTLTPGTSQTFACKFAKVIFDASVKLADRTAAPFASEIVSVATSNGLRPSGSGFNTVPNVTDTGRFFPVPAEDAAISKLPKTTVLDVRVVSVPVVAAVNDFVVVLTV